MGCSSSTPVKDELGGKEDEGENPNYAENSHYADKASPLPGKLQRLQQNNSARMTPNSRRSSLNHSGVDPPFLAASEQPFAAPERTASSQLEYALQQHMRMNSRQSLLSSAKSGSLGALGATPYSIEAGWDPGKAVVVRQDPRTLHIVQLATAVIKMPLVALITYEFGRFAVGSDLCHSPERGCSFSWLPEFCDWLFHTAAGHDCLVIEDTLTDKRSSGQSWREEGPKIRFVCAVKLTASPKQELIGYLAASHTERAEADSSVNTLMNLAKMAERELDSTIMSTLPLGTLVLGRQVIPPILRYRMDVCTWPKLLIDVSQPSWTILYGPPSVKPFLGISPGYLEGKPAWDFFAPSVSLEDGQEPWAQYADQLEAGTSFQVPSLVFKPNGQTPKTPPRQLVRAGMRKLTAEAAELLDVEEVWCSSLWLMWLQPETQEVAEPLPTVAAPPMPFPGVELAGIIGKGSFGYVRRGQLGAMMVAVKVIDAAMVFKLDDQGMPLEASLGISLRHPNIVILLDYATHITSGRGGWGGQSLSSRTDSYRDPLMPEDSSLPGEGLRADSKAGIKNTPAGLTLPSSFLQAIQNGETGSGGSTMSPALRQSLRSLSASHTEGKECIEAWFLLEYCDQGSLMDAIQDERFVTKSSKGENEVNLDALLSTAYEIALAMRYLHSLNILHGDLTAGNVLLTTPNPICQDPRGFIAKVADFGLSRQALTSRVATKSYGTVTHMPPEVLNEGLISKAADVYAFGVLLVEMYRGERAHEGKRHPQILHLIAILKKHPELPDTAPAFLIELTNACMHPEPEGRPSFEALVKTLRPHHRYGGYDSAKKC